MISKENLKGGVYYFYYTGANGKRKKKSLRTTDYETALLKADEIQNNSTSLNAVRQIISLVEFREWVLNYAKNNHNYGTYQLYETTFKYLICFFGENKKISEIKTIDIEMFKTERMKFVKPTTVNCYLRKINASFNLANRFDLINFNPAKKVTKLREVESQRKVFNENEFNKLVEAITDKSFKNLVLFGKYTGCRVSELVNLQWNDINLNENHIEIRNKEKFTTKTGKNRKIPISVKLIEVISQMEEGKPDEFIFLQKHGKKFSKDRATRFTKRYLRKAKLPEYLTFHCLRHTFITNLLRKGVSIYIVKKLAGHADIKTTEIYAHLVTDDLRGAVNIL